MPTWATRQAAKWWVGLVGAAVLAVLAVLGDDAPRWLTVVTGVLTAVGVYLTPNADPPHGKHEAP